MSPGAKNQTRARIAAVVCVVIWVGWISYGQAQKRDAVDLVENGNAFLREHRNEQALAAFDRALEKYPELPSVRVNRGIALQRLGRSDDALRSFREEEARTASPNATLGVARLLREGGNPEAALRALNRIAGRSDTPTYHRERGLCLLAEGQYEEAQRHLLAAQGAGVDDTELEEGLEQIERQAAAVENEGETPSADGGEGSSR